MRPSILAVVAASVFGLTLPAEATSCRTDDECLCVWDATVVADVEVTSVDRPVTTARVIGVTDGGHLALGDTIELAREPADATGQRRFVYFDQDQSVVHVVPVEGGRVTCAVTQNVFTLPADDAFEFAVDQSTCSDRMHEARLVAPECAGAGAPRLGQSCSATAPGLVVFLATLWFPVMVSRRRR